VRVLLLDFDAAEGKIFLYYSLNTHKLDADTRKDPIMDAELYIEIREVFIIGDMARLLL